MLKGILFALCACFIWGWIFVIPQFLVDFSVLEICLGRYLIYGILSLGILLKDRLTKPERYPYSVWGKALFFSLSCTMVYYTCVILALRYSSPAVCALILGISPITIAFYGNWKKGEVNFKSLILPSILILFGLVAVNAPHVRITNDPVNNLLGLIFCLVALGAWSWYVVANSDFLKKNPHIASQDWSTLLGVSTLFWVLIYGVLAVILLPEQLQVQKYSEVTKSLMYFLAGCSFLGIFCSWLGAYLWNNACLRLPVSLAGHLTIFETIFSLIFIYSTTLSLPSSMEYLGIALFFSAVFYSIRQSAKAALKPIT